MFRIYVAWLVISDALHVKAWIRCVHEIVHTSSYAGSNMIASEKQKDADRKIKHWLENERRVVSVSNKGNRVSQINAGLLYQIWR